MAYTQMLLLVPGVEGLKQISSLVASIYAYIYGEMVDFVNPTR